MSTRGSLRQGIVVQTSKGREKMLENFLGALPLVLDYPFQVVENANYELGAIRQVYEEALFDEFLFLHDTCEIKTPRLFDEVFKHHRGVSVSLSDWPSPIGMFLGKYRRETLSQIELPVPKSKQEAVDFEVVWPSKYAAIEPVAVLQPPLRDGNNFVTKFGKTVMKLENDYLIKYKSVWNRRMV